MTVLEKEIEQYLCKAAKKHGGFALNGYARLGRASPTA